MLPKVENFLAIDSMEIDMDEILIKKFKRIEAQSSSCLGFARP
jgi:hypothetical protein